MNKPSPKKIVLLWFRNTLRLHDLPLLSEINKLGPGYTLIPIFIFSEKILSPELVTANRVGFLMRSLQDLNTRIQRKYRNRLIILKGDYVQSVEVLVNHLNREYGSSLQEITLAWELYSEPERKVVDLEMEKFCRLNGLKTLNVGHSTLWDIPMILKKNFGLLPGSMTVFLELIKQLPTPQKPMEPPKTLPSMPENFFATFYRDLTFATDNGSIDNSVNLSMFPPVRVYLDVPRLERVHPDYKSSDFHTNFVGGETEALERLEKFLQKRKSILEYRKPMQNPTKKDPESSCLSPYLKFGCLSPRLFYHRLQGLYKGKKLSVKTQDSLMGQLYWREFFYLVGFNTQNFSRIKGNPLCKQIKWDHNSEYIRAWELGETGFPSIGKYFLYFLLFSK